MNLTVVVDLNMCCVLPVYIDWSSLMQDDPWYGNNYKMKFPSNSEGKLVF